MTVVSDHETELGVFLQEAVKDVSAGHSGLGAQTTLERL